MKIATIAVRILLGALYVFSAISVLFQLGPAPELEGRMATFMEGMVASGYLLTFVKVTELICGLALISGFFVPLATVVIFPISLNILMTHIFTLPEGLPVAVFVIFSNLFLAYRYRDHYRPLLEAK